MNRRAAFTAGVRRTAPVMLGVVPFSMIAGAAAVGVGLSVLQAMALSVVVFAGASQLAAIELLGQDATLAVVIATALVINSRFVIYSASLAPHFLEASGRWRAVMAYVLTDQAFAVSITRFAEGLEGPVTRRWFYLGTALPLWAVWQLGTIVGAVVGARVPAWLPLEFAVPLTFLALLVPAVEGRASGAAALVGGGVATAGIALPFNLGLLAGALAGIAAGVLVAERDDTAEVMAE
ncbi:MAG: AzlC family ABC transporter permease [Halobacteriales archaeon]|nr:AzlC family ABC transporter permease [Halobacteriales archaeon]